jgi:hypothetical protein
MDASQEMQEMQAYRVDLENRKVALDQAARAFAGQPPQAIVEAARLFEEFLSGKQWLIEPPNRGGSNG